MNIANRFELKITPQTSLYQQLIAGLKSGDSASFELLVRDYGGRMLSTAKRYLRNEADAQDCVQDAYIQAFRSIHNFDERASIATWLHRIVVNAALMKIRSKKRRPEEFIEDNETLFNEQGMRLEREDEMPLSVEDGLINKETQADVRHHIDQLPESARNLLLLRDIEGYSTIETSELLGLSISGVKTGLHRARKLLKKMIQKA